jgi:mono/diheme cytochrome c family protein
MWLPDLCRTGPASIIRPKINTQQKEEHLMRRVLAFAVITFILGTAPFLTNTTKADEYAQGKKLYSDKCQICHGVNGKGDGPAASALSPKPANFTDSKFWQGDVDKKITDTIENGHGMMPAFDLKPAQIKDIIDYLAHAFKPKS